MTPGYWMNGFFFHHQTRDLGAYTAHAHPGIEVHFCEEGEGWFQALQFKHRLAPGRLTVLYAPTFHHVVATPRRVYCRSVLEVSLSIVQKALSFVNISPAELLPSQQRPLRQLHPTAREHAEILRLFQQLSRVRDPNPYTDPRITLYLAELFYIIKGIEEKVNAAAADLSPSDHYLVKQALALMQNQTTQTFSPHELAEDLGVSRGHLWRVFKHVLGVSPQDFLQSRRMEVAKCELAAGKTVSQVAKLCGYADVHSFSRAFRRDVGVSPRAFRRNLPGKAGQES